MDNVYDKMIALKLEENGNKPFECQVTFLSGMVAAGALYTTPVEGLYSFRTLLRRGDPKSGPIDAVDVFFTSAQIGLLAVPVAQEERSGLVTPDGNPVLPKPRMQ
jgi:hypothetical protein